MNMKSSLMMTILLSGLGLFAHAQDRIFKVNGTSIEGKVIEVGPENVSYKKWDNPEGPLFSIQKEDVDYIEFSKGNREEIRPREHRPFSSESKTYPKLPSYGNHILSFSPFQANNAGVGFGLSYEAALDENHFFSFYLPVSISFPPENSGYYGSPGQSPYFFVSPGLKIYPTGGKGKIRYSVGPNLTMIYAHDYVHQYPFGPYPGTQPLYRKENIFLLGLMVTNGLNMNPTEHLHLALEIGVGASYYSSTGHNYGSNIGGLSETPAPLIQVGFKMGYRF